MIIVFVSVIHFFILYSIIKSQKSPFPWEVDKGFWKQSFLWININNEKRRKLLKYLFFDKKTNTFRDERVPLWHMIVSLNVYLDLFIILIGIVLSIIFKDIDILLFLQAVNILFILSSSIVCIFFIPAIEYFLYKFFLYEDKYIQEPLFILKIFTLYIIIQLISSFVMYFMYYTVI